MSIVSPLVKLIVFAIVTTVLTAILASTIGQIRFTDSTNYRAVFSDATGLLPGDDVRIAGVRVGKVEGISIVDRTLAEVTFSAESSQPLAVSTNASIRYRNLVGQRFVALSEGAGPDVRLEEDGLIPLSQTQPALDLTVLFNGFKPLFQALNPEDVNSLAFEIIQTLQGEGGTINSLLSSTASLTSTLADRDATIGRVIDQFNVVLGTIDERDERLSDLILQLQRFNTGFASDREAIGSSLQSISDISATTAGFLEEVRPPLREDIRELGEVAANLDEGKEIINGVLQRLPTKLNTITRTASYGSFFNFYLCDFDGRIVLPTGEVFTPNFHNEAARCNP